MNTPVRSLLLIAAIALSACGPSEEKAADAPAPEGRAETQSIRTTEAVGYGGNAVADKVDGALDASGKRKEEDDRAIEEQTQ